MHPPMTISKASANDRPQVQEETSDSRPPPLEDVQVCKRTPWPNPGKTSGNLFEERKDCLLPPNYLDNNNSKDTTGVTRPKPSIKEEPKTEEQSITNPRTDKCGWWPNCPFCKNQGKEEEDWNGNCQKTLPQQEIQMPQARCPLTLNYQRPQNSQKPNQEPLIDQYPSQSKTCKQWEVEMEGLKAKYNLDCFFRLWAQFWVRWRRAI